MFGENERKNNVHGKINLPVYQQTPKQEWILSTIQGPDHKKLFISGHDIM